MFFKKILRFTSENKRVELKFNSYSVVTFLVIISILFSTLYYIASSIAENVSKNYASLYSFKTTTHLNSAILQDLTTLRSVVLSDTIKDWFEDEDNPEKRKRAFESMNDYLKTTQNSILYFGIVASGGEFNVDKNTTLETFVPSAKLSKENDMDSWYFDAINSENQYELNVDTDKILKRTFVWINHKVIANDGRVLGVIATGITFDKILTQAFKEYKDNDVRGVVVDRNGFIQIDSSVEQSTVVDNSTLEFKNAFPIDELNKVLYTHLKSYNGFEPSVELPEVVTLPFGAKYDYVAISPIENTDWSMVTFFNTSLLFPFQSFVPLIWMTLALFFIYVFILSVIGRKLVFIPLARLVSSLRLNSAEAAELNYSSSQNSESYTHKYVIYGTDRHDEIGLLANTIQDLHNNLDAKNAELMLIAKKADSANEAKSVFLANMSHEIRTPMNAIVGMTKIARDFCYGEKAGNCLSKIETASTQLLAIINDVLDMSKIEANKIDIHNAAFDFTKMLQRISTLVAFRLEEKRHNFSMDIHHELPRYVISDEQRIAQVITNFLTNAVKFTPENGNIYLQAQLVETQSHQCIIKVHIIDTGIGVTEQQQKSLFKPFQQANSSISHTFGGTGLGLAISKQLIELLGGEIIFESEPNKGTKIGFILPCALPDKDFIEAEVQETTNSDGDLDLTGKHFLLVDDIEINREIVMALLEETGVAFDEAENGLQAVQKFTENPDKYSMILMDIRMPEMDGHTASREIRKIEQASANQVPIIAMTANAFREDVEQCLAAGMNGHVGKPIDFTELFILLKRYA